MRIPATLSVFAALTAATAAHAAQPESYGGFLGLTGAYVDSNDADETGTAVKLVFGPNITDKLSLEFGLMDLGQASYDIPNIVFPDDSNNAPRFSNVNSEFVDRVSGADGAPGEATYNGPQSFQARSILLNLRYNFTYTESIDFFVKGGANAWIADVEKMTVTAYGDGTVVTQNNTSKNETSGVELITGAGMMWNPWAGLNVRAEIESTSLDSYYIDRTSFMLYSLGLQYEF